VSLLGLDPEKLFNLYGASASKLEELPGWLGEAAGFIGKVYRQKGGSSMSALSKYGPYAGGYQFDPGQVDPFSGGGGALPAHAGGRRRRMNPMNARAARRAVARLRGTLKLLHRIEKLLPHRRAVHHSHPFHRRRR